MFDSVQVRFKNTIHRPSPFANTRVVPFVENYLEVLKSVVDDIRTEYFWFFANFMDIKTVDLDYIPEQHERHQMHVWYNTHTLGGTNKEGNVFLIPTKEFKRQVVGLKYLRDFKDINYHDHNNLFQNWIVKAEFDLKDPYVEFNKSENYYIWLKNAHCKSDWPNFFPSFWEAEKIYSWGKTKDILLVPYRNQIKQFYDIPQHVHFEKKYPVKPMDIIFLSFDEPGAEEKFEKLKAKHQRAKWSKGSGFRQLDYVNAAALSETDYFFFVTPKQEIHNDFDFEFQPDRMKNPCHYIFNAKNPVNGLEYGHGAVLLYNKKFVLESKGHGLDFTLSSPHEVVPVLSCVNNFNQTPIMAWRTTFREVIKLLQMKKTVESNHRLNKWCTLGQGDHAEYVYLASQDAQNYFNDNKNDLDALKLSFELEWLNKLFNEKYG